MRARGIDQSLLFADCMVSGIVNRVASVLLLSSGCDAVRFI